MTGEAVEVTDANISTIVVVRGKNNVNNIRFEAYLGYNKNNFKIIGKKKIYKAQLLSLTTKDTQDVDSTTFTRFGPAQVAGDLCLSSNTNKVYWDQNGHILKIHVQVINICKNVSKK